MKAKYLNREWLADIHTKSLSSLTITKIGGEVKSLRAEAWTNDKNKNKRNEPLSKQMERELSKFSRFRKPTPLQAWVPDKNQPNANKKSLQPTQANLQNKRDTDKEQKTVPLIPDEKPSTEDNNLVTIGETETENITSAKPNRTKREIQMLRMVKSNKLQLLKYWQQLRNQIIKTNQLQLLKYWQQLRKLLK